MNREGRGKESLSLKDRRTNWHMCLEGGKAGREEAKKKSMEKEGVRKKKRWSLHLHVKVLVAQQGNILDLRKVQQTAQYYHFEIAEDPATLFARLNPPPQ